nr:hypothetical protein GCM10025732_14060 [Glycomyces mayteni]
MPGAYPGRMRGLLAAVAVVLVEFAVFAMIPTGPVPAGVLALLAAAVVVALWQRYRRAEREQEAAVNEERLRLARDMHDRIGRRLGLAAVQAAALEVRETDPERRAEARRVGDSLRGAVEDLHGLVAVLRGADEAADVDFNAAFDHAAAASLAARFIEAGARVEFRQRGEPGPFTAAGSRAAYAVLEEGLANAAKHAPGTLVVATVAWEDDALLVTVENPLPGVPRLPLPTRPLAPISLPPPARNSPPAPALTPLPVSSARPTPRPSVPSPPRPSPPRTRRSRRSRAGMGSRACANAWTPPGACSTTGPRTAGSA